jgi:hypothetical protein
MIRIHKLVEVAALEKQRDAVLASLSEVEKRVLAKVGYKEVGTFQPYQVHKVHEDGKFSKPLKDNGLDVFHENDARRFAKHLNSKYPEYKFTHKKKSNVI